MSYENIPLHLNTTVHRFEMTVEGESAFIDYKQSGNTVYLVHTEVAEALEGRGVAAALTNKTLQYLEDHQLKLVPLCSYIQHYVRKHPEWKRLVVEG